MFRTHHPKIKKTSSAGLTFVELVVVLGIFAAVAATVLFNYRGFSNNVALQNLAQEVALQIKRAQTDAVSGRSPTLSNSQQQNNMLSFDWTPSFGIAFDKDTYPGSIFYYFNKDVGSSSEITKDFFDFEVGSFSEPCGSEQDSECIEKLELPASVVIDSICFDFTAIVPQGDCSDAEGTESSSETAYISFTRPRGNATIMEFDNGNYHGNVFIRLATVEGGKRYIAVWESGYISIK